MGILDDVVINAKSAAEAVGRKAGQIVDVSKLRISAAEHYASFEEAKADAERFRAECNRLGVTRLSEGREINNGIDRMIALRIPPQFGLPEQPVEG